MILTTGIIIIIIIGSVNYKAGNESEGYIHTGPGHCLSANVAARHSQLTGT